jgi:hypothetical protein
MTQLSRWTDFDEIWGARYATGRCPKIVIFNFLQLVIPKEQTHELDKWKRQ